MAKSKTKHSVVVDVPVRTVYNQWTQFEEFPKFMEGVERVIQDGPDRVYWKVNVAGRTIEYNAAITEQIPDRKIAWTSIAGRDTGGEVEFEPIGPNQTRVTLDLRYAPEGVLESVADLAGVVSARTRNDLDHFKTFIEQRGTETGGWRGKI